MKKRLYRKVWLMFFLSLFLVSCFLPVFPGGEKQIVSVRPDNCYDRTLVAVADLDYDPYSFLDENGEPSGSDIEFLYELANRMKVNIEIRMMPWTDCRQAVLDGGADMITGLDYRPNDYPGLEFSMALHNDRFVCFGRTDFSIVGELYGKKIAALEQSGSFVEFLIPYHLVENTTTYLTYTDALESVISGKNDYAIVRYSVGRRILAKLGESDVHVVGPSIANNSMCVGFKRGNTELKEEVDRVIRTMMSDGTLERLSEKWLGKYVEFISWKDVLYAYRGIFTAAALALIVLTAASGLWFYKQKARIIQKEYEITARGLEYQKLLMEATEGLYDNVYEIDITHNCAGGKSTREYFARLGLHGDTPYSEAIKEIACRQIREDYREGYLNKFSPEHVISAYSAGETKLSYDFMTSEDGAAYYWMRISARIFFWSSDRSVRMIVYRQNIDEEKRREQELLKEARQDSMTGLYNKAATERLVKLSLAEDRGRDQMHAMLILDVDCFKNVNDTFGHAFGDFILQEFANSIRGHFSEGDIVGRVGGDEFLVFIRDVPGLEWLTRKLELLNTDLAREISMNNFTCRVSASIGAVLEDSPPSSFERLFAKADQILYEVKRSGKNAGRICTLGTSAGEEE